MKRNIVHIGRWLLLLIPALAAAQNPDFGVAIRAEINGYTDNQCVVGLVETATDS